MNMSILPEAKVLRKQIDDAAPAKHQKLVDDEWSYIVKEILDHADTGATYVSHLLLPETVERLKSLGYVVDEICNPYHSGKWHEVKW